MASSQQIHDATKQGRNRFTDRSFGKTKNGQVSNTMTEPRTSPRLGATNSSGAVTINALGSTSATFVNDEPMNSPRLLRPGDIVRIGDIVTRFEVTGGPRDWRGSSDEESDCAGIASGDKFAVTRTVASPSLPPILGRTVALVDNNIGPASYGLAFAALAAQFGFGKWLNRRG